MSANTNKTRGSGVMELDSRKLKILQAIIKNYLETGEPVGSRTISKYTDLNLSSATIRNEMADLEELGFIFQPYTSSGRIPSDKGYRLYVDNMMVEREIQLKEKEKEIDDMKEFLVEKVDKVENLLKNMAKLLATNTNYATMITKPVSKGNRLKFLQLSIVECKKLLCVMVLDGNVIKNKLINLDVEVDNETVLKFNILLNSTLNGLSLEEINLLIISKITGQAGEHQKLIKCVVDALTEAMSTEDELEIYTSGATNIFKYPELSDSVKASQLISTLEEKKLLTGLIDKEFDNNTRGIQIYIGDETPVKTMKDCSVVTATYELEDGVKGTIGVIGPKRMDYEKVVETLKTVKDQLDIAYNRNEEDNNDK